MKKIIALVLAIAMVFSLAACGGGSSSSSSNDTSIDVTIQESTLWDFDGVYMTTADNENWGANLISETFADETTITLDAAGTYDLRLQDDDGDYWDFYGLEVADGSVIVVSSWSSLTCDGTEVEGQLVSGSGVETEAADPASDPGNTEPVVTADAWDRELLISMVLDEEDINKTIWYVYMSTSTSTAWGDDLLAYGATLCDFSDGTDTERITITSNDGTTVFDLCYMLGNDWLGVAGIEMDGVEQIIIYSGNIVETYDADGNLIASYDAFATESPM